jgi:hypothetical protein
LTFVSTGDMHDTQSVGNFITILVSPFGLSLHIPRALFFFPLTHTCPYPAFFYSRMKVIPTSHTPSHEGEKGKESCRSIEFLIHELPIPERSCVKPDYPLLNNQRWISSFMLLYSTALCLLRREGAAMQTPMQCTRRVPS